MERALNEQELETLGRVRHARFPKLMGLGVTIDELKRDVYLVSPLDSDEVVFLYPDTPECILLRALPSRDEVWYKNSYEKWTDSTARVFRFRAIYRGRTRMISDKMEWLNS